MSEVKVIVVLRIVAELLGLAQRALQRGGQPITQAEIDAAFARMKAAEDDWADALQENTDIWLKESKNGSTESGRI